MNTGFLVAISSLGIAAIFFIGMMFAIAVRGGSKFMTARERENSNITIGSLIALVAICVIVAIISAIVGLWI